MVECTTASETFHEPRRFLKNIRRSCQESLQAKWAPIKLAPASVDLRRFGHVIGD